MNELSHCRNSTIQAGSERNSTCHLGESLHSIIAMSDRKLGSDDSAGKTAFYEGFMKINTEWWWSIVWAIGGWVGAAMVSDHSWRSPVAFGMFFGVVAGSFTMWYVIHLETKQGT